MHYERIDNHPGRAAPNPIIGEAPQARQVVNLSPVLRTDRTGRYRGRWISLVLRGRRRSADCMRCHHCGNAPLVYVTSQRERGCAMNGFDLNEYLQEIEDIIANPEEECLGNNAPVVAMFLMEYRPELPPKQSPHNMTSAEIVGVLEDTCRLATPEVSEVMVKLGYRLWHDPIRGRVWSMTSDTIAPERER